MLDKFKIFDKSLDNIKGSKVLINTINAYSYILTLNDELFENSLKNCEVLIPDGVSIVWAMRLLYRKRIKKIAGADLFKFEMNRINSLNGKVFFLGSSDHTLDKIKSKASVDYPNVKVYTYSPPYKAEFSTEDTITMIEAVNKVKPDVLFIGMTAPKQEKWAYENYKNIEAGHIGCIGAVFDFYAGNIHRAPQWMIAIGFEWFYRLIKEPQRLWKRYLYGNTIFIYNVLKEKIMPKKKSR